MTSRNSQNISEASISATLKGKKSPFVKLVKIIKLFPALSQFSGPGSYVLTHTDKKIFVPIRIWILPSTSKKIKNLEFLQYYDFLIICKLLKLMYMYPRLESSKKTRRQKKIFCWHLENVIAENSRPRS
jgi:hypothetical protein